MVEEIQRETVGKYEQIKNEVHQVREENKEGIRQIQTDMGERLERVYGNLNSMEQFSLLCVTKKLIIFPKVTSGSL